MVEYFVESVEQYAQRKKEGMLKEVVKKYLGSFEKVPIGAVDKCLGEYERVSKDRPWNPFSNDPRYFFTTSFSIPSFFLCAHCSTLFTKYSTNFLSPTILHTFSLQQ